MNLMYISVILQLLSVELRKVFSKKLDATQTTTECIYFIVWWAKMHICTNVDGIVVVGEDVEI